MAGMWTIVNHDGAIYNSILECVEQFEEDAIFVLYAELPSGDIGRVGENQKCQGPVDATNV